MKRDATRIPSANITNGKIDKFFIKGYLEGSYYYPYKEYDEILKSNGKKEADAYLAGYKYKEKKRSNIFKISEIGLDLFNRQMQTDEVIQFNHYEIVNGYRDMPLIYQSAYDNMRRKRMLANYPNGATIEIYDIGKKPSIGIMLPLAMQDQNDYIAFKLTVDNARRTKHRIKNKDKYLNTITYQVAGKVDIIEEIKDSKCQ